MRRAADDSGRSCRFGWSGGLEGSDFVLGVSRGSPIRRVVSRRVWGCVVDGDRLRRDNEKVGGCGGALHLSALSKAAATVASGAPVVEGRWRRRWRWRRWRRQRRRRWWGRHVESQAGRLGLPQLRRNGTAPVITPVRQRSAIEATRHNTFRCRNGDGPSGRCCAARRHVVLSGAVRHSGPSSAARLFYSARGLIAGLRLTQPLLQMPHT